MRYLLLLLLLPFFTYSQFDSKYRVSSENPYGKLNPEAPQGAGDFGLMIGTCDCISTRRNPDQSWDSPKKMIWTFKYIMNGNAIQDESIFEDGNFNGNIRQFIADSSKWFVHYYSKKFPTSSLPTWGGGKRGDSIVLYRDQKAPNGMEGKYRITFSDISEKGFNWSGDWMTPDESIVFPTWKIECIKRQDDSDLDEIKSIIEQFSLAYENANYNDLANFYTEDSKIFPIRSDIISGREAIKKKWTLPEGVSVLEHNITPEEIKVVGDLAYDYGYYDGITLNKEQKQIPFKGKYVIVWKKVNEEWKIYLDIWNRIK